MIVVNTETIPGFDIVAVKGLVQGNTIRAKHLGRDITASLKNLVGGELTQYTELLTESRRQAVERMIQQAHELGADAIVNVRFTTSSIAAGAAELYAYGTAVTTVRSTSTTGSPASTPASTPRPATGPASAPPPPPVG
jgi:uncharacterized protein YbjQ (UPF0145 family)